MSNHWIGTLTGKRVDLVEPWSEQITIDDIALGLSRMPRFAGQTSQFYSVAQHSVLVAHYVPHHLRLQALLHDATEAYLSDLPRPVKSLCPMYRNLEVELWKVIAERFHLPEVLRPEVKQADDVLLVTEKRDLCQGHPPWDHLPAMPLEDITIVPWSPEEARVVFLEKFHTYQSETMDKIEELEAAGLRPMNGSTH